MLASNNVCLFYYYYYYYYLEGIRIEDETTQVSVQISQILFNHHVIAIDTVTYKLHP